MNSSHPLSGIDSVVLGVYRTVAEAADQLGIRWVIIGATARDLVYENWFGVSPRRRTADVDLAIEVDGWADYARLRTALVKNSLFEECPREQQRLRCKATGLPLDIVPFGGVEEDQGISWPPDHAIRMSTHGLAEAMSTAIPLVLQAEPDISVHVVHPAVLVATKLFAWSERPDRRKDAGDAAFMICKYERILDNQARLFTEHSDLLERDDFDLEAAYAELMGRDIAKLLRALSLQELRRLLAEEVQHGEASRFVADMALQGNLRPEKCLELVMSLDRGVQLATPHSTTG
jgi:predicted nucleotidyltransferase